MGHRPELIVMLTYNDLTVENALEVFEQCRDSKALYWGFKEKPLSLDKMKKLSSAIKASGKTACLEVVEYTEQECLAGAETAVKCGIDILMGTLYFDSVNEYCKAYGLKYMPFVGDVKERPSILEGSVDKMIEQARELIKRGVYGIDLLGYRYTGDASELNRRLVRELDAPVCIAGSVNSFDRLDEIARISPWSFTIVSAFFDGAFGSDITAQIDAVYDYINK